MCKSKIPCLFVFMGLGNIEGEKIHFILDIFLGRVNPILMGGAVDWNPILMGGAVDWNPILMGGAVNWNPILMEGAEDWNPILMGGAGDWNPSQGRWIGILS